MKILQVHNLYNTWSGEATVVTLEKKLLENGDHTVIPYYKYSSDLNINVILLPWAWDYIFL